MINQNLYNYNKENAKKVEILAPAGSYDIMKAVIQAGADAVYLGGDFFGARAFAGNFHQEELIDAIEYAHQFDRKIYLTVNTLLKDTEIKNRLVDYLKPYYEAGLDAVIVQDFGVFNLIRKHFPDLHIHASTQMTQTGPFGAELLQKAGAVRVVTSRELNCQEIKAIHEKSNVEIESFVHGALCYCYSGQCLLSSFNGGRSGNRGRCAQPCRLPYNCESVNNSGENYILSPKDMCALTILPDVIEAGVYSLKIEGRMKNVTYAAGVTAIYRKYVDMYLKNGRKGYKVDTKDINDLMDLYNRGAFTQGYYTKDKGREMLSLTRPNHMGTKALRIVENVNGRITCKALEDINAHDVFEIDKEHSFSSGESVKTNGRLIVNLPKKYRLMPGMELYRTRNDSLTQWVKNCFTGEHLKKKINMSYSAITGSEMSLTIYNDDLSVTVYGPVVGNAMKQPASEGKIKEQLCKLGDTILEAEHVEIILSQDAFVPASQLNECRRAAASKMVEKLRKQGARKYKDISYSITKQNKTKKEFSDIHVLLGKTDHIDTVLEFENVSEIYLEYNALYDKDTKIDIELEKIHKSGRKVILALPHILKQKNEAKFEKLLKMAELLDFDGYLVRNMEEFACIGKMSCKKKIITDAGLYIANTFSKEQMMEFAKISGVDLKKMTLPFEMTSKEMENTADADTELVVYANIPMMLSEQCVRKTFGKCDHRNGKIYIKNKDNNYMIKSNCEFCYTIMYENKKLDIRNVPEINSQIYPGSVRIEFLDESESEIRKILSNKNNIEQIRDSDNVTTGHFYRGVE